VRRGATFIGSLAWTVAAFLVLSGCVSPQDRWEAAGEDWFKKGGSRDGFLRDKARCEAETAAAVDTEAEADWRWATAQGVGTCLHGLGYRPWGERDIYDRARETIPRR
jgi:hypothetical protein